MGIWAHPDDESWSSAGIMATAVQNGQSVCVLSATNGDAGQTSDESMYPQSKLRDIRKQEFRNALQVIGVKHDVMLDYDDGTLAQIDAGRAIKIIGKHIRLFKPDTILTFEEHGVTGHSDHRTISHWTQHASRLSERKITVYGAVETKESYESIGKQAHELFNVYFAIDKPVLYRQNEVDLCFVLADDIKSIKRQALIAHASQTQQLFRHDVGEKLLESSISQECFIKLQ